MSEYTFTLYCAAAVILICFQQTVNKRAVFPKLLFDKLLQCLYSKLNFERVYNKVS